MLWEVSQAPEQQSLSAAHVARRGAQAAAVSTQIPSSHVASATHDPAPLQTPSTSTRPPAAG
jgi:hypothetical protein